MIKHFKKKNVLKKPEKKKQKIKKLGNIRLKIRQSGDSDLVEWVVEIVEWVTDLVFSMLNFVFIAVFDLWKEKEEVILLGFGTVWILTNFGI